MRSAGAQAFAIDVLRTTPLALQLEHDGDVVHASSEVAGVTYDLVVSGDSVVATRGGTVVEADALAGDETWVAIAVTLTDEDLTAQLAGSARCAQPELGCHESPLLTIAIRIAVWGRVCLDACSQCARDPQNHTACNICNGPDCAGVPGIPLL